MLEILTRAGSFIAIIVLGFVLKKIGVFREEDFTVLSKITIRITLPAAIITSFAGKEIDPSLLVLLFLGIGCGAVYILLGFLLNLRNSREEKAFDILNLPGYNIGCFSMPFAQSFLGPMGVIATSLFDSGNAFICLGGAFGVARAIQEGGKVNIRRIVTAPLHAIPFLAHILMVCLNLLGWNLPAPAVELAGIIGNANAFLAMLMIGVGFKLSGDRTQIGSIVKILSLRYAMAAVLALGFYFLLPFGLEIRQALVILAFSPIGTAVPIFTAELDGDVGLSAAINSIAIVCSIVIIVALLLVML
jgi:predicted permease